MISSVEFRNFKALRGTSLTLMPFNLVLGPNGSGKTSLIQALLQLRTLAALAPVGTSTGVRSLSGREVRFHFLPPHDAIEIQLGCVSDDVCDLLQLIPDQPPGWPALRREIGRIRNFEFDHEAMAEPATHLQETDLNPDGGNLASVLAEMREIAPDAFAALSAEALRLFPEFSRLSTKAAASGNQVALALEFLDEPKAIGAGELSQGTLFLLGILALAFAPAPPSLVCIENVDRGIHPRMLRELRDVLYRLSYPASFGMERAPVQVIATTHSPYLLDLFRDHPEEIVLTQKHGREAHFERLADRGDLPALLEEGTLGDLWFSGILGAVPERE